MSVSNELITLFRDHPCNPGWEIHPKGGRDHDEPENRVLWHEGKSYGSNDMVTLRCRSGHQWRTYLQNIFRGFGCPVCPGRSRRSVIVERIMRQQRNGDEYRIRRCEYSKAGCYECHRLGSPRGGSWVVDFLEAGGIHDDQNCAHFRLRRHAHAWAKGADQPSTKEVVRE